MWRRDCLHSPKQVTAINGNAGWASSWHLKRGYQSFVGYFGLAFFLTLPKVLEGLKPCGV